MTDTIAKMLNTSFNLDFDSSKNTAYIATYMDKFQVYPHTIGIHNSHSSFPILDLFRKAFPDLQVIPLNLSIQGEEYLNDFNNFEGSFEVATFNLDFNNLWNSFTDADVVDETVDWDNVFIASGLFLLKGTSLLVHINFDDFTFYFQEEDIPHISKFLIAVEDHVYIKQITPLKPTPTVKIVEYSNYDKAFTSTHYSLPHNPITDNMLKDSYRINIGSMLTSPINGKDCMDLMVSKMSETSQDINGTTLKPGKGLYIMHGVPGSGKSKFISQLMFELNESDCSDVLYFPPQVVSLLGNPSFTEFLMSKKNAVIIIEDAEAVLANLKSDANVAKFEGRNQETTNILNLIDGILGDILQLTFICTFNCQLSSIDPALLRPGRLQMNAEFLPLTEDEALKACRTISTEKYKVDNNVLDEFAFWFKNKEATLAEVYKALEPVSVASRLNQ